MSLSENVFWMQERLLSQVHRRYRVDVICVTKGDLFSLQGSSPEAAYPNPTYGIKERIWTLMHKNPSSRKRYSHCLGGRVILQNMCGMEHSQSRPLPPRDIWFWKVLCIKIPFPVRESLFPQENTASPKRCSVARDGQDHFENDLDQRSRSFHIT